MKNIFLIISIFLINTTNAQIITTIAGTGTRGYNGDDIAATTAQIGSLIGLKIDNTGAIFFCDGDNLRVRKIDAAGMITTIAGTGIAGFSGDGGPATAATLNGNWGIAIDNIDGVSTIYIGDAGNYRVRKISAGIITTIAGDGSTTYGGNGGPATGAQIGADIIGIALDAGDNVYICEGLADHIRKINTTGIIANFAGIGTYGYGGDGGPATAAEFTVPYDIAFDGLGNAYFGEAHGARVRKIDTEGIITTIAGNGATGYTGDNGPATVAELSAAVYSLAVDVCGNVFLSDYGNNRIRVVNTMGIISTVAGTGVAGFSGDGGPVTAAELYYPAGMAMDAHGNIYFFDFGNYRIRKITYGSHPPAFVAGHTQHLTVCENDTASIDTMLTATDLDAGQQEAWKVTGPATHGTASALYATTSTGGALLPTGLYYAPAVGYTGNDTFTVQVSDCGTGTDVTTVYVNVPNCSLGIQAATTYGLLLYPNPTAGSFSITLPAATKLPAQVTITDIVGKTVAEINTTTNKKNEVTLHVADGVYFITATAGGKKYYSKLVVSKS